MTDHLASARFQALLESALRANEEKVGVTLAVWEGPLARLRHCHSINDIMILLRDKTHAINDPRQRDRLFESIRDTVSILTPISGITHGTSGADLTSLPHVKAIHATIGILLSVCATLEFLCRYSSDAQANQADDGVITSYDKLANILESIKHFLHHLKKYTESLSMSAVDEAVVKLIVELLSTVALVVKKPKKRHLRKWLSWVHEINEARHRPQLLLQEALDGNEASTDTVRDSLGPFLYAIKTVLQSLVKFDRYSLREYMQDFGRAYHNQAMELIAICRLASQVARQVPTQDADLTRVFEICDQALLNAAGARKEKIDASDDDIKRAIQELKDYVSTYSDSEKIPVEERMKAAKEKDKKPRKREEDPSWKVIQFHIMKHPIDTQPTIVQQELNDNSKLEEILWNFSRYYPPERRLTLSQNPHFYDHLPTSSTANWKELYAKATQENWHTYHPEPICVLTNAPSRVFLELCHKAWTFDNVWSANGTLIFKSVCGKLEGEGGIVRTSFQHNSWCHVEHLASRPNQTGPSNHCVLVEKWIHELRQALPLQNNPNSRIRLSECTEPARGCCFSGSDRGSTESLGYPKGVSSLAQGERTGGHGIVGSDEGSTDSLEAPERGSPPTRGERTRWNGIACSDEGSTESPEWPECFFSPTRGEWAGAHSITAFSRLDLLICLLGILADLCFS